MASVVGPIAGQKIPKKRSVTPSRTIYTDYPQAYNRIISGGSSSPYDLDKMPSPSPGHEFMNDPFQKLNPSCKDLPKVPRHMIRPGPLSPLVAEQIFNQTDANSLALDVETERSPSPLLPPPPVAPAISPSSVKVVDYEHVPHEGATSNTTPRSDSNTSINRPMPRGRSKTSLPPPVRWDRPSPQTNLSESKTNQRPQSPSGVGSDRHHEITSLVGDDTQWETVGDFSIHSESNIDSLSKRIESGSSIADVSSGATSSLSSDKSEVGMRKSIAHVPWDPINATFPTYSVMDSSIPTLPTPTTVKQSRRSSSYGRYHHPLPLPSSHIHPLASAEITGKSPVKNPFADPEDDSVQKEFNHPSPHELTQASNVPKTPLSLSGKASHSSNHSPVNFPRLNPQTPQKSDNGQTNKLRHNSSDSSIRPIVSASPSRARGESRYKPVHNRSDTQETSWYAMQVQASGGSLDNSSMVTIDLENRPAATCPHFDAYTPNGHGMKVYPNDIPLRCLVPFQSAYCHVHHRREFPIAPTLRARRDDSDVTRLRRQRQTGKHLVRVFTFVPFIGWLCLVLVAVDHSLSANLIRKASGGSVGDFHWRERQAAGRRCVLVAVVCALAMAVLVALTITKATETGKTWQPD